MDNTHYDRHFHLQGIGEDENVVGTVPFRIESHEVGSSSRESFDRSRSEIGRPFPARRENAKREGENIVVEETGVNREETHKEDDVTSVVESVEDLDHSTG